MPNVGTITGSMYLDPSAYVAGLNTAAGATRSFQQGVSTISFAGFNRGIFATTTLLYGLGRIMSNMSKGMEEYANMLGRIGTVADLTAASVSALADSMKQISVYQGVSRKNIMGGMYTAAQAGYETPAEMRAMAASGARLSRASGKEIDVKKSVDLQSGIRQALGIGMNSVSSNRMNDILLRGRDIGRWELDEMAQALGIPLTVWGNQFAGKESGEETLRQLLSIMSVASLSGVSPRMTATGTRRIVEKTLQLNKSGKVGDPLRNALRGAGFGGQEPILDALNQGGMRYLNTLMSITGGGQTSELTRLGYGSRDLLVLTSALRGKAEKLNRTYEELSYGNAAGTTERYGEKMRQTYDYSRDRLRAQWEITSQQFMQASIPLIGQFTNMLEGFNKVAQALPDSVKSFMLLIGALSAARLALNFLGFHRNMSGGVAAGARGMSAMPPGAMMPTLGNPLFGGGNVSRFRGPVGTSVSAAEAQAARLARRQGAAASRNATWRAGFGQGSASWVGVSGTPWGTSYSPFTPMAWNEVPRGSRLTDDLGGINYLGAGGGNAFGPRWYNAARGEPMNYYQAENMKATNAKLDAARAASNARYWAADGSRLPFTMKRQFHPLYDREMALLNTAALGRHYLPGGLSGRELTPGYRAGYGPSVEQRIRWAAYQRGQSVNFENGSYGSLSPAGMAYQKQLLERASPMSSMSVRELAAHKNSPYAIAAGRMTTDPLTGRISRGVPASGLTNPILSNLIRQMPSMSGYYGLGSGTGMAAIGQATSSAVQGLSSFGSALFGIIGPFLAFSAAISAALSVAKGWSYTGRQEEKDGGKSAWPKGNRGPGFFSTVGYGYEQAGSFLHHGSRYTGDIAQQYAEAHGFVPFGSGNVSDDKAALPSFGRHLFNMSPFGTAFRGIFPGDSPLGLEGYRRATPNDVLGMVYRNEMSRGNLSKFGKKGAYAGLGVDFSNFDTVKPHVSKYVTEQLGWQKEPEDWSAWASGNLKNAVGIVTDALNFAGKEIEKAAAKAAYDIAFKSKSDSVAELTKNYPSYLAFTSGYETLQGLEGMQKTPFAPEKSARWESQYASALAQYHNVYGINTLPFGDQNLRAEREELDTMLGKRSRNGADGPIKETLKWNERLRGMGFLANAGKSLAGKGDEELISNLNLDRNMDPRTMQAVLGRIRGLDYTNWTQTFTPPQAPFSQALQYGTKEGYNATLERRDQDPIVMIMGQKLQAVVDTIVATESANDEKMRAFETRLRQLVGEAVADPIVEAIEKISPSEGNFPVVD